MGSMRTWATPLTAGAFLLLAVTGSLMFFRVDLGLNKFVHEWLGWALIAGGLAHALANWNALKSHLKRPLGAGLVVLFALVLVGSFLIPKQADGKGGGGQRLVMERISSAPITALAPIARKTPEQLASVLAANGVTVTDPAKDTLRSLAGKDRGRQRALMEVIFAE